MESSAVKAAAAPVTLSEKAEARIEEIKKLYPDARSAIMPALYIAQEELGHISEEAIQWVAQKVDVAPVHVMEVATFYTMYYKKPVGKYHVQVCRTLSCALCGSRALVEQLRKRFGTRSGEVTADGKWSYEEVECLGSCGSAPMCEINDCYFENLTQDKLASLLDRIEKEQPDLRFSTVKDQLGEGLKGAPKSEVL
jgi:NADH-quinone oxidoreductase E subunit